MVGVAGCKPAKNLFRSLVTVVVAADVTFSAAMFFRYLQSSGLLFVLRHKHLLCQVGIRLLSGGQRAQLLSRLVVGRNGALE